MAGLNFEFGLSTLSGTIKGPSRREAKARQVRAL